MKDMPSLTHSSFDHVDQWVFDLDNTLYPPSARLFDLIEPRMTEWVARKLNLPLEKADQLRHAYWREYGTTLAGLMDQHQVDPHEFLGHVHDIPLTTLRPDHQLAHKIKALPGRKIVYTNAPQRHADRVLEARGLSGAFHGVYGVEMADFLPKPDPRAFAQVFARAGVLPGRAAMFEDDPRNLLEPHRLGMRTVHVADTPAPQAGHIHHHARDLAEFLAQIGTGDSDLGGDRGDKSADGGASGAGTSG